MKPFPVRIKPLNEEITELAIKRMTNHLEAYLSHCESNGIEAKIYYSMLGRKHTIRLSAPAHTGGLIELSSHVSECNEYFLAKATAYNSMPTPEETISFIHSDELLDWLGIHTNRIFSIF